VSDLHKHKFGDYAKYLTSDEARRAAPCGRPPTSENDRALPLTLKRALIEQAERLYYRVGNQPVCSLYTAQEMIRSGWLVLRAGTRSRPTDSAPQKLASTLDAARPPQ
jgi:hypothetical protein